MSCGNEHARLSSRANVVTHVLRLGRSLTGQDATFLQAFLCSIDGVVEVGVFPDSDRFYIRYDAGITRLEEIAGLLQQQGYQLSSNWLSRIKRSWLQYQDDAIQESMKHKAGSCCSNPGDVYVTRRNRR